MLASLPLPQVNPESFELPLFCLIVHVTLPVKEGQIRNYAAKNWMKLSVRWEENIVGVEDIYEAVDM